MWMRHGTYEWVMALVNESRTLQHTVTHYHTLQHAATTVCGAEQWSDGVDIIRIDAQVIESAPSHLPATDVGDSY